MRGFTLIELSIVLVIIGLIVGGITAGQSLVQSARISSVTSDIAKYESAFRTFELQYDFIPGDLPDATAYWGTDTANGNGDGRICCAHTTAPFETFLLWNQLSQAEVLPDGFGITSEASPIPGQDIPAAATEGGGWWAFHSGSINHGWDISATPTNPIYGRQGNVLALGAINGDDYLDGSSLTSSDMSNLDSKIDDGIPNRGKIFAIKGVTPAGALIAGCVSGNPDVTVAVTYLHTNDSASCRLVSFF